LPVQGLAHQGEEDGLHRGRGVPGLVELFLGGAVRVEAHVPDPGLGLVELGQGQLPVAGELADQVAAAGPAHHRHDGLAGDVPAHDQDIGLIEPARVEELAPAHLAAVDVGGEVDPHRHLVTSSGR
jgi:hypothetical protein